MATTLTTRRTLATLISRALSHSPSSPLATAPRLTLTLLTHKLNSISCPTGAPVRFKTSGSGYSPLNDSSPNWSNRPPKATVLLDGCDYEHWLIVMEFTQEPKPSEDEMISAYVKALASVVGSEEEAKKKIYSVSTTTYTGFGALISEELSYKMKEIPGVLWVLPDSYLDVPNQDYGGDLFVDGKVIHRPQYRYDDRQPTRSRPRVRYDRRRETMQTVRREPMRRDNWDQDRREPIHQPAAANGQNGPQSGGGGYSSNQGGYQGPNA
ncbi:multiple organellar RNA editing factor 3, mitochondrial [Heracleum sosnowskyi]|uniref:Multiple organellar RNA editing factor 3, mitochondrial n=1 Tax=Heracleum sosnowskyi TaxID=360622 RepID=A0AAD8ML49_9APIA|nr:multiple organellar RNA editing factor 3, mitochondrial [Heracleum sosnowskyi]